MDDETIIIVSVFSAAWAFLLILVMIAFCQVSSLKRKVVDLEGGPRVRVQKLSVSTDKNHAFHNPVISPDEELSRRGYSMYVANEDVESGRTNERQTGGQFVEELTRELETRQHQQQQNQQQQKERNNNGAPPFLLQAIEENKRKGRALANPMANQEHSGNPNQGRSKSDTNPNFIY